MQKKSELQWTSEVRSSFRDSVFIMFGKKLSDVQYEEWDDVSEDDETEGE